MAARAAAATIKGRLKEFAAQKFATAPELISFHDNKVFAGNQVVTFAQLAKEAYLARISLSSTGFYRTPKIDWDAAQATGQPFFYFAYGAACSEVTIDTLTGEMKVDPRRYPSRRGALAQSGDRHRPDRGRIRAGHGLAHHARNWCTTRKGGLLTHAPSTYKIPCASDVPADFRIALYDSANREDTIYRSKAVGEPPLMLAISVFAAIADAIHSLAPGKRVALDAPATPESILHAIHEVTQH